jgi:hypothetical protein
MYPELRMKYEICIQHFEKSRERQVTASEQACRLDVCQPWGAVTATISDSHPSI